MSCGSTTPLPPPLLTHSNGSGVWIVKVHESISMYRFERSGRSESMCDNKLIVSDSVLEFLYNPDNVF